jgi:hypothetical protein
VTTTRDVVLLTSLAASSALTIVLGLTDPVGIPVIANRFLAFGIAYLTVWALSAQPTRDAA